MDGREYDIILYGASSCTSRYIIRELEGSRLRIALSARTVGRIPDSSLPKIECPLENIGNLTKRTRLLFNCVGPYALTGLRIIGACIATSTHYIDISGETQFLRETLLAFDDDARQSGVKIVQACGFDSVPADIGTMHLCQLVDSPVIDSTIRVWNCKINTGTWHSLLNSMRSFRADSAKSSQNTNSEKVIPSGSRIPPSIKPFRYNVKYNCYDVAFKGSDSYVVRRSSDFFRDKGMCSAKYLAYVSVGSWLYLVLYFVFGLIITRLARFQWGYDLMIRYPRVFSFGLVRSNGPTEEEVRKSSFELDMVCVGPANEKKVLKITGPDPGYVSTAILSTQCAFILLENEGKIESGVLTPAMAFYRTDIVERLSEKGIAFRISDF